MKRLPLPSPIGALCSRALSMRLAVMLQKGSGGLLAGLRANRLPRRVPVVRKRRDDIACRIGDRVQIPGGCDRC